MNTVYTFLAGEVGYALGWTVVHSLWQAMLIALLLAGVLIGLQKRSAHFRYILANLSMLAIILASALTFNTYYQVEAQGLESGEITGDISTATAGTVEDGSALSRIIQDFEAYFELHLPLILCIWLLGVAFFLLRLLGGVAYVQHLKHYKVRPLAETWQRSLEQLAVRLRLRQPVQLMESALVKAPMVIGYLKPVILLPVGAINGLSAQQVEAVLAHELAHIYRRDYLFNILQSLIEALYYFNPAVWWISANIRMERENCCDDIAVELCGNSLVYAKALVKIEETSQRNPRMAMALARKGKGRLLHRVKRILNQPQNKSNIMEKFTATALLLVAVVFFSFSTNHPVEAHMDVLEPLPRVDMELLQPLPQKEMRVAQLIRMDTLPKGKVDFHSHKNGKEVKARVRNQKIVKLEIDGQEIPKSEFAQYEEMVEEMFKSPPMPPAPPAPPAPSAVPAPPAPSAVPALPAPPAPSAAPALPAPPAPPAPRGLFSQRDIEQVTARKQTDGSTAIIIEKTDGEKIELLVSDEEDGHIVYLDGEELEDGATKIIIEEGNPQVLQFRGGEHNAFWFDDDDAEGIAYRELMEQYREQRERIQEAMEMAREQNTEERQRLMDELRARQEEIREQTRAAMQSQREQMRQNREEMKQLFEEQDFKFDLDTDDNTFFFSTEQSAVKGKTQSALEEQLLADGLIDTADNYKFEISGEGWIKVNGKKQPAATYEKYRKLWQDSTGEQIDEDTHIRVNKKSQAR